MHLKQDQKALVLIGICLAALVAIGFILVPTINYIKQADRETFELRQYLEKREARSLTARSSLKQIEKIKDDVATFDRHIFHQGDELKLITLLEDLAIHNNVSQQILSSNLDKISNQRIAMSLQLNGTYGDVLQYLTDLEHANYFLSVSKLSLNAVAERNKPSEKSVNLQIDFTLYVAN